MALEEPLARGIRALGEDLALGDLDLVDEEEGLPVRKEFLDLSSRVVRVDGRRGVAAGDGGFGGAHFGRLKIAMPLWPPKPSEAEAAACTASLRPTLGT